MTDQPVTDERALPDGRHFLGWDRPALVAAVDWLSEYASDVGGDLTHLLLVVPAARASRRLMELLVDAAGGGLPGPPTIVTMGQLPESLFEPGPGVADAWHAMLGRATSLRDASEDERAPLLPRAPQPDDWASWWALGQQLHHLSGDLAAHRLTPADVLTRCEERGIELPHPERWQAVATLEQRYHAQLSDAGLMDAQIARLAALRDGRCRCDKHLVLIATADLNPLVEGMVQQVQSRVTALVHAPEHHAEGFNSLGGLSVDYWQGQPVAFEDDQLRFVDHPADQARAAAEAIGQAHEQTKASDGRGYRADEVSVGLGDETQAATMQRTLRLAGLSARYGPGEALTRARPAMLLSALGRFAEGQRFDDLSALLRHPDIETYLLQKSKTAGPAHHGADAETTSNEQAAFEATDEDAAQAMRHASEHWLVLLDRYANEHLQGRVDGHWLGDATDRVRLQSLWDAITALVPVGSNQRRALPAWSETIAAALNCVYGQWSLDRHAPHDDRLLRALQAIGDALREQASLAHNAALVPHVTFAQAITLTLRHLADAHLPEPGGQAAVELMGYLDLAMDDAPLTIVASLNEGCVPAAMNSDPLLPNSLRQRLGLADNDRRYARDLLRLNSILASRPSVTLLAARQTGDGDPLSPSRLLLACDDATLQQRVQRFYKPETHAPAAPLLTPGDHDRFLIPPPATDQPVLDQLRVTAFADYLTCPYRFYLKHVRRLGELDDAAQEMDPLTFGSLVHEVLKRFGKSTLNASDDVDTIAAQLSGELDRLAAVQFGQDNSHVAVRLQIEQMRQRLYDFARAHAQDVQAGWHVIETERDLKANINVDGQLFTLTGRVDRIDYHPDKGYRILDYKTADRAKTPAQTHHGRDENGHFAWRDLQLPLYYTLGQSIGLDGTMTLGYFNLPKQQQDAGIALAPWDDDDLEHAMHCRDEIIRAVRDQRFWPPNDPPAWPDEYTRICADEAIQRDALIEASSPWTGADHDR